MMAIVSLLGGVRATIFAGALLGALALLGWQRAITIPNLKAEAAAAVSAEAKAKAEVVRITSEMDKCVNVNKQVVDELKRVTEDMVASERRANEARAAAEAKLTASSQKLRQLEKDLANAPLSESRAPASLVNLFDGLRN